MGQFLRFIMKAQNIRDKGTFDLFLIMNLESIQQCFAFQKVILCQQHDSKLFWNGILKKYKQLESFFLRSNLLINIEVVKCTSMYAIQLLIQTIVESAGSQHQATELLK